MSNCRLILSCLDPLHPPTNSPIAIICTNINNNNSWNKGPNSNNNEFGTHNTNDDHNHHNDDHNHHGRNGWSLCDYLQLHTMTPSCLPFHLNINHFKIKSGIVQLLPKYGQGEPLCATLRTWRSMRYHQLAKY